MALTGRIASGIQDEGSARRRIHDIYDEGCLVGGRIYGVCDEGSG